MYFILSLFVHVCNGTIQNFPVVKFHWDFIIGIKIRIFYIKWPIPCSLIFIFQELKVLFYGYYSFSQLFGNLKLIIFFWIIILGFKIKRALVKDLAINGDHSLISNKLYLRRWYIHHRSCCRLLMLRETYFIVPFKIRRNWRFTHNLRFILVTKNRYNYLIIIWTLIKFLWTF